MHTTHLYANQTGKQVQSSPLDKSKHWVDDTFHHSDMESHS